MTSKHETAPFGELDAQRWWMRGTGKVQLILALAFGLGLLLTLGGIRLSGDGSRDFLLAYLVAFAFCLSLSLGALFFLITQHLCRAGWSVAVRRPAEVLAASTPVVAIMFLPIAWSVLNGRGDLYAWSRKPVVIAPQVHQTDHGAATSSHEAQGQLEEPAAELGAAKRLILQPTFFVVRWIVFLGVWSALGLFYWWNSVQQDRDRSVARTRRRETMAAPAAVLFGVSVTWAAFDLLMSLNANWQSTMFGVYYFAGSVVAALSLCTLATVWLRARGQLPSGVGTEHYMDYGRLMFGFVFFWGYIAFSQYMLLWYANVPVELTWLRDRGATTAAGQTNAWSWVLLFLLFGHFLVPFAGLMSRHIKKRPGVLAAWAGWLLLVHFVDLAWIVLPQAGPNFGIGPLEIGIAATLISVFLLSALGVAGLHALVPLGDPRLAESMRHESAY